MAEEAVFQPALKRTILSILCPELIVEIFSHLEIRDLGRVALVCKQFTKLAYSKRLWKNVEFLCGMEQCANKDVVHSLMQKGIQRLRILPNEQDLKLQHFQEMLPEVKHLILMLLLLDSCPLARVHEVIKQVDFSGLRLLELGFYSEGCKEGEMTLEEFLKKFPNLHSFTWIMCAPKNRRKVTWVNDRVYDLKMVLVKQEKLAKLHVCFNNKPIPFPFAQVHQSDILEHLTLESVNFNGDTLLAIGQCFPNLHHLGLASCCYTGKNIAKECSKYLGHIRELEIHHCQNIAEKDFNSGEGLKSNDELNLSGNCRISLEILPEPTCPKMCYFPESTLVYSPTVYDEDYI